MELVSTNVSPSDFVAVCTPTHMSTSFQNPLEPFKTNLILCVYDDLDRMGEQRLVFEVDAFPGETFTYPFDRLDLVDLDDWREITTAAIQAAREFFRSLYIEPEDNIILGED